MVLRRGLSCARRTVQRVHRREGLRVLGPARQPRCPTRPEATIKAEGVNDVWCLDLDEAARRHSKPRHLRSDNGGEFIARVFKSQISAYPANI